MHSLYEVHSPEELYDMITWLPDDAALWASIQGGPEHRGWTVDRILQVLHFEATQQLLHSFVKANSDRKTKIPAPEPIDFPGRPKPKKKGKTHSFMGMVRSLSGRGQVESER